MSIIDPTPDPRTIRLQRHVRQLIDAALAIQYDLATYDQGDPVRCEWSRVSHGWVHVGHEMRDYLEEDGR